MGGFAYLDFKMINPWKSADHDASIYNMYSQKDKI